MIAAHAQAAQWQGVAVAMHGPAACPAADGSPACRCPLITDNLYLDMVRGGAAALAAEVACVLVGDRCGRPAAAQQLRSLPSLDSM